MKNQNLYLNNLISNLEKQTIIMKNITFILFAIFFSLTSCCNDDETTQEEDNDKLEKLYQELVILSEVEDHTCNNPDEWSYTKLADVCGGERNIIYYKNIKSKTFFEKVELYKKLFVNYTKKWGGPNCSVFIIFPGKPIGLDCYNEKPRLIYEGYIY